MASARGKISDVWKFFSKTEEKAVVCDLCKVSLAYCGGTSNLIEHLKRKHATTFESVLKKKEAASNSSQQKLNFRPSQLSKVRHNAITEKLALFIAMDGRPFSLVEGKGFKEFLLLIEPGYSPPCSKTVKKNVVKLYDEVKYKLKEVLSLTAEKYVALTTDIWTACNMEPYITVTLHYIDLKWTLKSFVLGTVHFPERHYSTNIAEKIDELLVEYSVNSVSAVTHDSASNMKKCIEVLNEDLQFPWPSHLCAGHLLNLCLQTACEAVPGVRNMLTRARSIVSLFHKSTVLRAELHKKQAQFGSPEHELIIAVKTRWNTNLAMCDRLLEQRWPVLAVITNPEMKVKRSDFDLSESEWVLMDYFINATKNFNDATELLSSQNNVSISCLMPIIHKLYKTLQRRPENRETDGIRSFKNFCVSELEKRFNITNGFMAKWDSPAALAASLDPRFRKLKFLKEEDRLHLQAKLMVEALKNIENTQISTSEVVEAVRNADQPRSKKMCLMLEDSDDENDSDEHISESDIAKKELELYFNEKPCDVNVDPLTWWNCNAGRFSNVAPLARRYLCVQATSTASERVFSTAGFIINKYRNSLKPENCDMLIFLKENLKYLAKD